MVVEIQHEKLGAKLHTDTFSYVKTCTRTRPCKHEHVWVVNTLRENMAVEKNIGNYVVSCTQTRPPMWQFAHGDVLVSQKLQCYRFGCRTADDAAKSASLWILFEVVSFVKAKGIQKAYVKKHVRHKQYLDVLRNVTRNTKATFRKFRSTQHVVNTVEMDKLCLCAFDDKRYILDDGISTLAYGHYSLRKWNVAQNTRRSCRFC